jgi:hypothetical protein
LERKEEKGENEGNGKGREGLKGSGNTELWIKDCGLGLGIRDIRNVCYLYSDRCSLQNELLQWSVLHSSQKEKYEAILLFI